VPVSWNWLLQGETQNTLGKRLSRREASRGCSLFHTAAQLDASRVKQFQLTVPSAAFTVGYFTSNSFVPADLLSRNTSTLYLPFGKPPGFEMWNSVYASPVGAIG